MPRKKTELGDSGDARIVELMRAGGTAKSIHAVLTKEGVTISMATVGRRMQDLKSGRMTAALKAAGPLNGSSSSPSSASANGAASADPDAHITDPLDRLLAKADRMAAVAEAASDFAGVAQAARLSASLLESKRKSQPLPQANPNEAPEMVKLGAECAERLEKMIAKAVFE